MQKNILSPNENIRTGMFILLIDLYKHNYVAEQDKHLLYSINKGFSYLLPQWKTLLQNLEAWCIFVDNILSAEKQEWMCVKGKTFKAPYLIQTFS